MTLDELKARYAAMTPAQHDALEAKLDRMDAEDDEAERWSQMSARERRWEMRLDRADTEED